MTTGSLEAPGAAAARAAEGWSARSRHLADAGQVRDALQTQWAADVATLHCLLWESGLSQLTDPGAQLDSILAAVHAALGAAGEAPAPAADTLRWARTALAQAFGEPVAGQLAARWAPADHLEPLGAVPDQRPGTPTTKAAQLREVARDCSTVARAMLAAGLAEDAADQRRRGLLAAYEAFLVEQSATSRDTVEATAGLRWELGVTDLGGRSWAELSPEDLAEVLVAGTEPTHRAVLRARLGDLS